MTARDDLLKAGHVHISEREPDGSWEDCTFDSGLEWYRLTYDARKPATHAEAEALRHASGQPPTGGSNIGDLRRGIAKRYGVFVVASISGFSNLKAALKPGYAAVVQGSMKAFGPTHPLSKWQAHFDGGHAVLVANVDGTLLWCDPLAPNGASVPVPITWAELEDYVRAFSGRHLVARIRYLSAPKESTVKLTKYLPGYTATVKASSNVRAEPRIGATKYHTTGASGLAVSVIGTVQGDVDPANGSNVWYAFWHDNRVEYTATDNIVNLKAPEAGGGDTSALEAELAAKTATVNEQAAVIAELKSDIAADVADASAWRALREALRGLLN